MGGRAPPGKDDGRSQKARAARNLGARGGGGCSVQLAHHQCRGSPSPPPTHPRRAAPAAIPVKIFSRKSAKNGSLLLTCSHATLRVLGFIENRLGNALMQTLILWFWRRSKLLEADAHGVSLRFGCALFLATFSEQTLFLSQLRLLSETNSTVAFLL